MKLPKQWKHWCKKANLRPESTSGGWHRTRWAYTYLNGRGRKWRIALKDVNKDQRVFQAGNRYDNFDRWALSERFDFDIPKTWAEFKSVVEYMDNI